MSDAKQPEQMRPIPDGGLKDAMPSWLKRPPAWRDLPNAEQRHERSLPEPDTSEIDPRSLVHVGDLPQWLQAIAARGDIPVPTPDAAVEHAVEVVQAAHRPAVIRSETIEELTPDTAPEGTGLIPGLEQPRPAAHVGSGFIPERGDESREAPAPETTAVPTRPGYSAWIWPVAALVIVVLIFMLYILS